jgi:hypothetical protein
LPKRNSIPNLPKKYAKNFVSEYLRQRALGYMPRAVLPEMFFSFNNKLDELCISCEGKITMDTEKRIIALIDEITAELILPQREKAVV